MGGNGPPPIVNEYLLGDITNNQPKNYSQEKVFGTGFD